MQGGGGNQRQHPPGFVPFWFLGGARGAFVFRVWALQDSIGRVWAEVSLEDSPRGHGSVFRVCVSFGSKLPFAEMDMFYSPLLVLKGLDFTFKDKLF